MSLDEPNSGAIREGEPAYFGNASRPGDPGPSSETKTKCWKPWYLLGLVAVLITVVACYVILINMSRRSSPHFHNEAARTFFEFVRASDKLRIDGKDVQKAFDECFVDGLPVAKIDGLLKTGFKRVNGKDIEYHWSFICEYDGHVDGFVLIVIVAESSSQPGYWFVKGRSGMTLPS